MRAKFKINSLFTCVIIFAFIINGFQSVKAQQPVFNHYSTSEGLPSPETYMTMQDSKGYIWISTDRGVCRFDGYNFETFTTDEGLNGNTIFGTYEDRIGRIWFFTYTGGVSYYWHGKIVNLFEGREMETWDGHKVPYSFAMDEGDTLWMATRYAKNANNFIKVFPDGSFKKVKYKLPVNGGFIKKMKTGEHFISGITPGYDENGYTLSLVDENEKVITFSREEYKRKYYGVSSFQRENGDILFTYMGALALWVNDTIKVLKELNTIVNLGLLEDRKGNVWIPRSGGGVLFFEGGNFENEPKVWLENKEASWITEDDEGGVWISTLNDGVYYTPSVDIMALPASQFFLGDRLVNLLGRGDTIIGVTKHGGVTRLIYHKEKPLDTLVRKVLSNYIGVSKWLDGESPTIYGYHNGSGGVFELDAVNLSIKKSTRSYKARPLALNDSISYLFKSDSSAEIWNMKRNQQVGTAFISGHYNWRCRYPDKDTLWMGGMAGLYRHVLGSRKIERFMPDNKLLTTRILDIKRMGDRLLVATSGKGVVVIKGDEVWNISTLDGLPSNICNRINFGTGNEVWISTNKGICRISNIDSPAKLFSLQTFDFLSASISKSVLKVHIENNMVWSLYDDGVIYFDRNKYQLSKPPPVYINKLEVNQKDETLNIENKYGWDENNMRIQFTGISYKSSYKLRYKFRMLGLDTIWDITTDQSVLYSSLSPGRYQFQVLAQNAEGTWSENMASLKFEISRPWWKTWWALSLEVFMILMVILGGPYLYLKRLQQKSESESKINQLKLQALQAQMNPHFVFNVLGAIQSFIASKESLAAQEYLASFATLIRSTLNHSTKTWVSLNEEIQILKMYLELEKMRFETPFDFNFEIDQAIDTMDIKVPTMLLQPFIENSVIHGISPLKDKGDLKVYIELEGNRLKCSIIDNGVGRHFSKKKSNSNMNLHKSYGIHITKERLEVFNTKSNKGNNMEFFDIKDEKGNAKGTKVVVIIPYIKDNSKLTKN